MNKRNLISLLVIFFAPIVLWGQSVSGVVSDGDKPLAGANLVVDGTDLGGVSLNDGSYRIELPGGSGRYSITASFIGYSPETQVVRVGEMESVGVDFVLTVDALTMSALEVLASRADEKTPVAYTTVSKADMEVRLGSQDIPMALNTTPSVYELNKVVEQGMLVLM